MALIFDDASLASGFLLFVSVSSGSGSVAGPAECLFFSDLDNSAALSSVSSLVFFRFVEMATILAPSR